MRRPRALDLLLLTVAAWAMTVVPANAYIDAGSVTVIFQGLVAGIAAGWFAIKLGWGRIASFFRRGEDTAADEPGAATGSDGDAAQPVTESSPR